MNPSPLPQAKKYDTRLLIVSYNIYAIVKKKPPVSESASRKTVLKSIRKHVRSNKTHFLAMLQHTYRYCKRDEKKGIQNNFHIPACQYPNHRETSPEGGT